MADNIKTYKYQLTSGDGKKSVWVDGKDFDANYEQYAKDCSKGSTIRTKDPKTGEEYDTPLTSYKAALDDGVRPFTKVTVNRPQSVTEQAKAVATKPKVASTQKAQGALESATSSRNTDQPDMAVLERTKRNWENMLNSGAGDTWNADATFNPTKGKLNNGSFDASQNQSPIVPKQKKTPITQTPSKGSMMVTKDEKGRIVTRSRYLEGQKADQGTKNTLKSIEAQSNQFADNISNSINAYIEEQKEQHRKNDMGFLNTGGGQGNADFGDDTNAKLSAQRYQMQSPEELFGKWTKDSNGNRVWKEGTLSRQGGAVDQLLASALYESDGNGGARIKKSIERDAYGKGMSVNGYVSSVLVPKIQEQLMSRLNQNEVVRNMPKNDVEYFLKSMRDSALGMILNTQKTSRQERQVQQQAMHDYEEQSDMGIGGHAIHAIGTTVGDLPLMMIGGWVGKGAQMAGGTVARQVGKTAIGATVKGGLMDNAVTRALATYTPKLAEVISPTVKRFVSPQLARRYEQFILANASKPQWYGREILKGALASPANMGTFMGLKNVEQQIYAGEDTSGAALWDAWNQGAAEGIKMGTVLNAVAPFGRYLGLKASTPLGRFGADALGKGLEIGSFMGMDYLDKTSRGEDWKWTESLAENAGMIIGMGVATHPAHMIASTLKGVRSAFWYKTDNKTINPDNGMVENTYAFNPVKAWRQLMSKDNNVKDLALSKEAKAHLKKAFPNDPFFDDAYDAYSTLGLTKESKFNAFEKALLSGDPVALKTVQDYNNKLRALLQDKENVSWRVRNEISAKMYGVGEASRPLYDHYKIEGNEAKLYAADGELIDSRVFDKKRNWKDVLAGVNGWTDEEYAEENKWDMHDFINNERNIAFQSKAKDLMLQMQGITDENDAQMINDIGRTMFETEDKYQNWQKNTVELLGKDPRKMDFDDRLAVRSAYKDIRTIAWIYNFRKGILSPEASTEMGRADADEADLAGDEPNADIVSQLQTNINDTLSALVEAQRRAEEANNNGGYGIDIHNIELNELYEMAMPNDDKQAIIDYISAHNRYTNAQIRYDAFINATRDKIEEHLDEWFEGVRFKGDGFSNPDDVVIVNDGENDYYLIDGTVNEGRITSESGMVGIVDRKTGETDWVDPSKLTYVSEEDKETHVAGLREFMQQQITAQYRLGDVPQGEGAPAGEAAVTEPQQPQGEDAVMPSEGAVAPEVPQGEEPQQPEMPTHEDGTPIYEQLEPKKTVELLNQLYENDTDDVSLHIANEIAKAGTDAKALQSKLDKFAEKVKNGKPIDMNERKAVKDALAEATARGQYWQGVKDMLDGEALKPQNTGEDAVIDDTQAFEANKQTYQQNKTVGAQNFIYVKDKKVYGHFVLGETGDTMPSHDPFNNYRQYPGVPRQSNGRTNNDRDYEHDMDAQRGNAERAQKYHLPNDMPIVSKDEGVVLSGNDRTMAHMLAVKNGKAGKYEEELREKIGQFGFTEEDLAKYEHPELRFELDEKVPYTTDTYAMFNAQDMKSMNSTEASVKNAKLLAENPQAVRAVMQILRDHADITEFYKDKDSQRGVVDTLVKAGVWTKEEVVAYQDKEGNLNRRGKLEFENVVRGLSFTEDSIRMLDDDDMLAINNAIVKAIPSLVENNSFGEYSIMRVMEGAVRTVYDAIKHHYYKDGNIFKYFDQGELFKEGDFTKEFLRKNEDSTDVYNDEEKALGVVIAHVLARTKNERSVKFLVDFLESYNKLAKNELDNNGSNMFGIEPMTAEEVSKAFRDAKLHEQITVKDKNGNETTNQRFSDDEISGIEKSIKNLLGITSIEEGTGEGRKLPEGYAITPEGKLKGRYGEYFLDDFRFEKEDGTLSSDEETIDDIIKTEGEIRNLVGDKLPEGVRFERVEEYPSTEFEGKIGFKFSKDGVDGNVICDMTDGEFSVWDKDGGRIGEDEKFESLEDAFKYLEKPKTVIDEAKEVVKNEEETPQPPVEDGEEGLTDEQKAARDYVAQHPMTEADIDATDAPDNRKALAKEYLNGTNISGLAQSSYRSVYNKHLASKPKKEAPAAPKPNVTNGGNKPAVDKPVSEGDTSAPKPVSDNAKAGLKGMADILAKIKAAKNKTASADGDMDAYNIDKLNDEQNDLMLDLLDAGAKLGFDLFKDGLKTKDEWKKFFTDNLGESIKDSTGFDDKDVDDLLEDLWNSPYKDGESGTTKRISEWAKDFGITDNNDNNGEENNPNVGESEGDGTTVSDTSGEGGETKPVSDDEGNRPSDEGSGSAGVRGNNGGAKGTKGGSSKPGTAGGSNTPGVPKGGKSGGSGSKGRADDGGGAELGNTGGNESEPTTGSVGRNTVNLSQEKVPYVAASDPDGKHSIGSVIPSGVASALNESFKRLVEDTKKNVTDFVRDELGYSSNDEMLSDYASGKSDGLASEQVDSVALAINSMKKGKSFIIGDMTGVGKGRQAAALIRWARENKKKVLFVTESSKLFSAMYSDLKDINTDYLPYVVNDDTEANITNDDGVKIIAKPSTSAHNALWKSDKYELPKNKKGRQYDVLMMTYSQAQNATKGNAKNKLEWIKQYAKDAIIIMDESHNASGNSNRGAYFKELVKNAEGVTFLSATYAKRPDNMMLYALRSSLSAVNMPQEAMFEAIKQYGVPMQEILANGLFGSGEMIRRERDMTGVKTTWCDAKEIYKDEEYEKARKTSDKTIDIVNDIIDFQKTYVDKIVKEHEKEFDADNQVAALLGAPMKHCSNSPYSGQVSNVVNLLTYGLKAKKAADMAIQQIKEGKKPVIAVENTLGSYVNDIDGDIDNAGFGMVFNKGVKFALRYNIAQYVRNPDTGKYEKDKDSEQIFDAFDELDSAGQLALDALNNRIEQYMNDKDIEQLSLSPIDLVKNMLAEAGYKCGEITGRSKCLVKNADGTYHTEPISIKKKDAANRFNGGSASKPMKKEETYDALILNVAGATGISLHSSTKFGDQRQRSMIILQPARDVNIEVQMRGRIDRTGQVHRGEYFYVTSPIPAEQKMTMMLKQKLASLDANAVGTENVSSNKVDAQDMDNKYGDEVAKEFLLDHLNDINAFLEGGLRYNNKTKEWEGGEGLLYNVLKGMQRMDCESQEFIIDELTTRYADKIEYLNQNGINDLKTSVMKLDAKTIDKAMFIKGKDDESDNEFAHNTNLERVEVNVLKKPLRSNDIQARMKKLGVFNEDGTYDTQYGIEKVSNTVEAAKDEMLRARRAKLDESEAKLDAKIRKSHPQNEGETDEAYNERIKKWPSMVDLRAKNEDLYNQYKTDITKQFNAVGHASLYLKPGMPYLVPLTDELKDDAPMSFGRFLGFEMKNGQPRNVQAVFAVKDSRAMINIPCVNSAKVIDKIIDGRGDPMLMELYYDENSNFMSYDNPNLLKRVNEWWDARIPKNTSRQHRFMITGNILQACGSLGKYKGQIVTFTRKNEDGTTSAERGMLLAENFDPENFKVRSAVKKEDIWNDYKETKDDLSNITASRQGDNMVVKFKKRKGQKLVDHPVFQDKELADLAMTTGDGTPYSKGKDDVAMMFPEKNVEKALELLYKNHSFTKERFFIMPDSTEKPDAIVKTHRPYKDVIEEYKDKYGRFRWKVENEIKRMLKQYKMDVDNEELKTKIREAVQLRQAYLRKEYATETSDRLAWQVIIEEQKIDRYSRDIDRADNDEDLRGAKEMREEHYNIREAMIEELEARGVHGNAYHLEQGDWTAKGAKEFFDKLNDTKTAEGKANKAIMDAVYAKIKDLPMNIILDESIDNGVGGQAAGKVIEYNWKYMNAEYITDQAKANTILHEMIHTVTVYACKAVEADMEHLLKPEMVDAVNELKQIFSQIENQDVFKHDTYKDYGVTNVYEMLSEAGSNESFRNDLRQAGLWTRILDGILRFFGFERTGAKKVDAYESIKQRLDDLIEGFNAQAWAEFYKGSRYGEYGKKLEHRFEERPREENGHLGEDPLARPDGRKNSPDGRVSPDEYYRRYSDGERPREAYKEWKSSRDKDVNSGMVSEPAVQRALQAKQKADSVIAKMVSPHENTIKDSDGKVPEAYHVGEGDSEAKSRMEMFTNRDLIAARKALKDAAKSVGGQIGNASSGAYDTENSGFADNSKAKEIAKVIIESLENYKRELYKVSARFLGTWKTDAAHRPFFDEIREVNKAIKWYGEFSDGMHNKVGDHADDGIRFRQSEHTEEKVRTWQETEQTKKFAEVIIAENGGKGRVVTDKKELDSQDRGELKRNPHAAGWYRTDTGEVVIYLPNCHSNYEIKQTVWHEKIGHEGIRQVLGKERFNKFVDKIWLGMEKPLRDEIIASLHKYGYSERVAIDEMFAKKAEDFTDSGHSFWQTVKNVFNSIFNTHFGEKDVRMALWLSKHHMENKKGSLQFRIEKAAFQFKLDHYTPKDRTIEGGVAYEGMKTVLDQELPKYLFSQRMTNAQREQFLNGLPPEGRLVADYYDSELKKWWYPWTEAWRNNMKSAEIMLEAITGKKMVDIESKYNIVDNLNQLSSKNDQAMQKLIREHIAPLQEKLLEIIPDFDGETPQERYANAEKTYFYAKHALEANRVYAVRDYVKDGIEKRKAFDQYLTDYQKEYDKYDKKFSNGDISEDEFDNAVTNFINAKAMSMLGKKVYSEYIKERDAAHKEYKKGTISIDNYFDRCNQAIESRVPSKDIDKFQGKFDAKRQQLKTDLDNGTITLKDYYDQLDHFIRNEIKDFDPATHDMGGLSDYDTFPQWADKDTRGVYDDKTVINHIMDCEARMGKDKADAIWQGINTLSQSIIDGELNSGVLMPKVHERMSTMFSWYLPLRGFDAKTAEEQYGYIDGAKVGVGPSAFSAKGRTVAADRPVETLFHLASNSLMRGNRNIAKMAVQRLVADHKEQNLLTPFEAVYRVETDSMGDTTLYPEYPEIKEGATPKEIQTALDTFEADIEARKAAGEKLVTLRDMKTGTVYRIVRERDKEQHFIHVMVNGKDTAYIINANPRAAQAINGMIHDVHIKYWDDFNRLMSKFNTSYSMTFMAANAVRDWEYATLTSIASENKDWNSNFHKMYRMMQKNNATGAFQGDNSMSMRHLFKMYRENKLDESNQVHKWFNEFVDNGGVTGYVDPMDKNDFSKEMDDMIADKFKTDSITTRTWKQSMKLFKKYGKFVDSFNEGVENHARFAAFCASRMEHRSVSRAVHDAKEISINFNRTGAGYGTHDLHTPNESSSRRANVWAASLSASYFRHASWFCNAGIQAMSRTFDLWCNGNKKQKALLVGGLCLAPAVAQCIVSTINYYATQMFDDDDDKKKYGDDPYAQLPPYMRRNNMCIYMGHGRWAMIPLAVELRAFYGLMDMGIRAGKGIKENQNAVFETLQQFSQLSPVDVLAGSKVGSDDLAGSLWGAVTPDNLEGGIAYFSNVGWTGRRIWNENEHEENKAGWAKAPASTNQGFVHIAKALNEWSGAREYNDQYGDIQGKINLNPARIQYVLESYMGGPGKEFGNLMSMAGLAIDKIGGTEPDWQNTNIPILKAIYHQQSTVISKSTDKSRWYEYKKEATNYTKSSLSDMKKHGNAVGYVKLYNSNEGKIMDVVDEYNKVIKVLQTQKIDAKTPSQRNYYDNLINYYISQAVGEIDKIEEQDK